MVTKTENYVGKISRILYNVSMDNKESPMTDMTPEVFSEKVEHLADDQDMTILSATAHFCDYYNISLRRAAKLLTPRLIAQIAEEEDISRLNI